MDDIKFITIQKIYAHFPIAYTYLKRNGYNSYSNAFFLMDISSRGAHEMDSLILMLSSNGTVYYLIPRNDTYELRVIRDNNIIYQVVTILDSEVNGRHRYLRDTLNDYLRNAYGVADNTISLF